MENMNKVSIPNGTEAVMANYQEQVIEEYRNNPFIESLPPIYSKEEVIDHLAVYPPFDEAERNLEGHIRYHLVQRVFQYFQPLATHIDLESRISRLIRQGYTYRSPLQPDFVQGLQEGHQMILNRNMQIDSNQSFRTSSSALTIIGASGIGKSTAINRVLSLFPQVIVHSNYKGRNFSQYQLVWCKLDCPHDGSIKGLCIDFFRKVDSLLGSNYYRRYGSARQPISSLQPAMAQLAMNSGLGLLVIDETQNLSVARSQGAEKMLNFFTTLVNTIGVPVVLIGTPKAMSILQSQFRQARRGSGQGDMVLERMKQDASWDLLIEGLWDYQWTKKPTPLTQELSDTLYDACQGITDIGIKLFAMSQIRAISSGKEQISASLIRKVAQENLRLVQPMLDALRKNDFRAISRFEDILPIDVGAFMDKESSNIAVNEKIKELQLAKKLKSDKQNASIKEQAILKLIELDITPGKAKKLVEQVLSNTEIATVNALVKESFKLSLQVKERELVNEDDSNEKAYSERDLRFIVVEGRKQTMSAYDALRENGVIKNPQDDLFDVG